MFISAAEFVEAKKRTECIVCEHGDLIMKLKEARLPFICVDKCFIAYVEYAITGEKMRLKR